MKCKVEFEMEFDYDYLEELKSKYDWDDNDLDVAIKSDLSEIFKEFGDSSGGNWILRNLEINEIE